MTLSTRCMPDNKVAITCLGDEPQNSRPHILAPRQQCNPVAVGLRCTRSTLQTGYLITLLFGPIQILQPTHLSLHQVVRRNIGLHLFYSHTSYSQATAGLVSLRQDLSHKQLQTGAQELHLPRKCPCPLFQCPAAEIRPCLATCALPCFAPLQKTARPLRCRRCCPGPGCSGSSPRTCAAE